MTLTAPDASPCWSGAWRAADASESLWAIAAAGRTVGALPRMHPWRLADDRGSGRALLWLGVPDPGEGMALLTQTAWEPDLPVDADGSEAAFDLWHESRWEESNAEIDTPRWMGGLARMPGAWLPATAVMAKRQWNLSDPGTDWSTESVDFAARYSVHSEDIRCAADILAPHVMALILDEVPAGAAVALAGDAIQVWLQETSHATATEGLVRELVVAAGRLKDAIPSFVLVDHPDRSAEVETDLADKEQAAEAYRRNRHAGRSADPTMQRIYDQARAAWEAGNVSSQA